MTTPAIMLGLLMAPLAGGIVLGRIAGRTLADPKQLGCVGLTLVLCFTGMGHFVQTEPMARMLPPLVPGRIALVYVTGMIELAAAAGVLAPRWRAMVGWGLIVMLLVFLPVNVYAAVNRVGIGGHARGPVYLLIRLPLQAILIAWIWWFAIRPTARAPVRFCCRATLELPPEEIARQILDLNRWPEFSGYGPLPGITSARFEVRTPEVVGTRIRVTNTDGSRHVEEIAEWDPPQRLRLHLHEFSPPLSRLATSIDETWLFERRGDRTLVRRTFELFPKSTLARPLLWVISQLLRRAVAAHLRQLRISS